MNDHDIIQQAADLPAPSAGHDLLQRIATSRAEGRRVVLPLSAPRPKRWYWAPALMAALVAGVLLINRKERPEQPAVQRAEAAVLTDFSFLPAQATAQTAPVLARSLEPIRSIDGHRLRAGAWEYELVVRRHDGKTVPAVRVRFAIRRDGRNWVVENSRLGHADGLFETTTMDGVTLHPIARQARNIGFSLYTVDQRFPGDSIVGVMRSAKRKSVNQIRRRLDPAHGPYLAGQSATMLVLRALPLERGFQGSFSVAGWGAVRNDLYYPVNLAVTGETPEAWLVTTRGARSGTQFFEVRKSDGQVTRITQRSEKGEAIISLVSENLQ
jgi:hypothetical protein